MNSSFSVKCTYAKLKHSFPTIRNIIHDVTIILRLGNDDRTGQSFSYPASHCKR